MEYLICALSFLLLTGFTWEHNPNAAKQVIKEVWDRKTLPEVLPERVGSKLIVGLPHGFTSVSTILYPKRWNGEYIIYHQGHQSKGWKDSKGLIGKFTRKGYRVVAMNMPLTGENTWPAHLKYPTHTNHNRMANLKMGMQIFLTPPIAVMNYLEGHRVHMTGVSGGGWTTTVICGIDPRIDVCASVAGGNPHAEGGDYEQVALWDRYLDLFVLASCSGKKLEIMHRGDPWVLPSLSKPYKRQIKKAGCNWKFHVTDLDRHGYGGKAAKIFLRALKPAARPRP